MFPRFSLWLGENHAIQYHWICSLQFRISSTSSTVAARIATGRMRDSGREQQLLQSSLHKRRRVTPVHMDTGNQWGLLMDSRMDNPSWANPTDNPWERTGNQWRTDNRWEHPDSQWDHLGKLICLLLSTEQWVRARGCPSEHRTMLNGLSFGEVLPFVPTI